jgi:hypothetical protein
MYLGGYLGETCSRQCEKSGIDGRDGTERIDLSHSVEVVCLLWGSDVLLVLLYLDLRGVKIS